MARENLDQIKEELNDAHQEFHETLDSEDEREALYHLFDLHDREFIECSVRLVKRIYAKEKKIEGVRTATSVCFGFLRLSRAVNIPTHQGCQDCSEYTKRCVRYHVAFLRDKGLCFPCLGSLSKGHQSRPCGARLKCKKRAKYHSTSLHEDSKGKKEHVKA